MFHLFLFLCLCKGEETNETSECIGKNTFIDSDGLCACLPNFLFGDPYSENGCFNCNKSCHINGECVDTDICKCKAGYLGDGETVCVPRFPLPLSIIPKNCSIKGNEEIVIELENETKNVQHIFCKFGTTMVLGVMITNKTLSCVAPIGEKGKVEVKVSDDYNDWNLPGIAFEYINNDQYIYIEHMAAIGACIIIVFLVVTTINLLTNKSDHPIVSDEDMPLIKNKNSDLSLHGFSPV